MNDDLEQRLHRLGQQPISALDDTNVAAIEERVLQAVAPRRRPLLPLLAAAAAVLLLAGAVFAFRGDRRDSLQPGGSPPLVTAPASTTTTTGLVGTTTSALPVTAAPVTSQPAPVSVAPVASSSPDNTVSPATTSPTVPATSPATTAPTTPPTTQPPAAPTTTAPAQGQPVPAATFTLDVRRVDGRLLFNWPRYEGEGGLRYVLVRVGPGGLTEWPPPPARIAATVNRIGVTFTSLDLPTTEPRRWVLVVLGADRELLAVSSPVTSS
jgi:hypothetical protein